MQEVWKAIAGYEGIYEVSDQGRIRSVPRRVLNGNGMRDVGGKILKDRFDKGGYKIIDLRRGHEVKTLKVHRLVAAAFIPNPENKPQVNHIQEDKKWLNTVDNLEWMTAKENMNYGTLGKRIAAHFARAVKQMTMDGQVVKVWESAKECGRNGFHQGHVSECCRGEAQQYKGYRWEYAE